MRPSAALTFTAPNDSPSSDLSLAESSPVTFTAAAAAAATATAAATALEPRGGSDAQASHGSIGSWLTGRVG
ncbi:unnamed protein product [Lota lota]